MNFCGGNAQHYVTVFHILIFSYLHRSTAVKLSMHFFFSYAIRLVPTRVAKSGIPPSLCTRNKHPLSSSFRAVQSRETHAAAATCRET